MSRNLLPLTVAVIVSAGAARADAPSVAVDVAPVHSLVARVMEGVGAPDLIVTPGASPHGYSLRPSEARALQNADVVFWIGPELTPWLGEAIRTLGHDAETVELLAAPGTRELELREGALFEAHDHGDGEGHAEGSAAEDERDDHAGSSADAAGHDDHEHGDGLHDLEAEATDAEGLEHRGAATATADGHAGHAHGALDPHAWLDPANAKIWLDAIAAKLSAADRDNAGAYFANAAAGKVEIDTLIPEIDAVLDPVRDRSFIVFHDAYQYFETAFGMSASGAISLGDATRPSPARVEEIRDLVVDAGVTCVLAEPQFNADLVETVLNGTEARSAVLDPLGSDLEPGPALYPKLLRNLARTLADCL